VELPPDPELPLDDEDDIDFLPLALRARVMILPARLIDWRVRATKASADPRRRLRNGVTEASAHPSPDCTARFFLKYFP